MTRSELFNLLEERYDMYCRPDFIEDDPIQIPHLFEKKEDREISGLITATIAWGQRATIIKNAKHAMALLGNEPHRFVMEHSESDLRDANAFVHRTFQSEDLVHFIRAFRHIYTNYSTLEDVFVAGLKPNDTSILPALVHFKKEFFAIPHLKRTQKHVADPERGSSSKRLNMFIRWMARSNDRQVDFGLWNRISPALLSCPLDVHSGRVARQLGLLHRNKDDWKAVLELDAALRSFDPIDPVKYDFALFGMGVNEKI